MVRSPAGDGAACMQRSRGGRAPAAQLLRQITSRHARPALAPPRTRHARSHVRPMPDDCVKLWMVDREHLTQQELHATCRTDFMYTR